MGSSTQSGTPLETRRAATQAGGTFSDLFTSSEPVGTGFLGRHRYGSAPIEDVFSRLSLGAGRLGTESQQNLLGFGAGDLDLLSAAQAVLNPQRFDVSKERMLLDDIRNREMTRATRGAAGAVGQAGLRFSGNADRAARDTAVDLGAQYGLQDVERERAENARVQEQQLAGLASLLQILQQAGISGQAGVGSLLAPILQFIQPGEPIYDPGLGRDLLTGLISGGSTLGAAKILA